MADDTRWFRRTRVWSASGRGRLGASGAIGALALVLCAGRLPTVGAFAGGGLQRPFRGPASSTGSGLAELSDCRDLNREERALAEIFEHARGQRRRSVRCDPTLARVARAKATDLGVRRYFRHVTPDGDGPNRLVERAGYALPGVYSRKRNANNVEVIAAGDESAADAWQAWLKSSSHRTQVLGRERFFAEQTDYGVGFADVPGSEYGRYWVLITARH